MRNIEKAISRAIILHHGQVRKGDKQTPQITHPVEVAMIVSKYANYEPAIIAAFLHDTVEDCNYTLDEVQAEFGTEVRYYVGLLTEDKSIADYTQRKASNLGQLRESLSTNRQVYFVKVADAISNMRSLVGALKEHGSKVWDKFNATKNDKVAYFNAILQDTKGFLPAEVFEEYVGLLKDLEYSETYEKKNIGFVRREEK